MGLKFLFWRTKTVSNREAKVRILWQNPSELALRETCEGDRETHPWAGNRSTELGASKSRLKHWKWRQWAAVKTQTSGRNFDFCCLRVAQPIDVSIPQLSRFVFALISCFIFDPRGRRTQQWYQSELKAWNLLGLKNLGKLDFEHVWLNWMFEYA